MPEPTLPVHKYIHSSKRVSKKLPRNCIRVESHERTHRLALTVGVVLNRGGDSAYLAAEGDCIPKLLKTVEYLKLRIRNLDIQFRIQSDEIMDIYEPIEYGLDTVVIRRHLPVLQAGISVKRITQRIEERDQVFEMREFDFQMAVLRKINAEAIEQLNKEQSKKKRVLSRRRKKRPRRQCFVKSTGDTVILSAIEEEAENESTRLLRNRRIIDTIIKHCQRNRTHDINWLKKMAYSLRSERVKNTSAMGETIFTDN